MDRNQLAGSIGDAFLAAAGYNFSLLIRWQVALLLSMMIVAMNPTSRSPDPIRVA
jgi:hypothetical protein